MVGGAGGRGSLGYGGVISPVGEQHQAWGVKEILKTTHSSHQNKSGRIKGTQICPFSPGEEGEGEPEWRGALLFEADLSSRRWKSAALQWRGK